MRYVLAPEGNGILPEAFTSPVPLIPEIWLSIKGFFSFTFVICAQARPLLPVTQIEASKTTESICEYLAVSTVTSVPAISVKVPLLVDPEPMGIKISFWAVWMIVWVYTCPEPFWFGVWITVLGSEAPNSFACASSFGDGLGDASGLEAEVLIDESQSKEFGASEPKTVIQT